MNAGRFFMPTIGPNSFNTLRSSYFPIRSGFGFFSRITNSLRSFNWSGLLNGANKTLNVVNQTIPLVRQAGPMFSNMKSMLRIARLFNDETKIANRQHTNINSNVMGASKEIISKNTNNILLHEKEVSNSNYPNFFI